jgi:membrane-associated phospholipid phosphatase
MGQACVIVYYTYTKDYADQSNDYPLLLAILLATLVVVVTAFGRVYLGVHSIPDLIGGFFFEVRGDFGEDL